MVAPEPEPEPEPQAFAPRSQREIAPESMPEPEPPTPAAKPDAANAVYDYLKAAQGARLAQIEAALGASRVQTVNALRSLIEQGIVTQRDRTYYINGGAEA